MNTEPPLTSSATMAPPALSKAAKSNPMVLTSAELSCPPTVSQLSNSRSGSTGSTAGL